MAFPEIPSSSVLRVSFKESTGPTPGFPNRSAPTCRPHLGDSSYRSGPPSASMWRGHSDSGPNGRSELTGRGLGDGWDRRTWERRKVSRDSSPFSTDTGLKATHVILSSWMRDRLGQKSHPALRLICYFHFLLLVPFLVKISQFPLNREHIPGSQGL